MDHINPDHYKNQTSLECIEAMEIIFGPKAVIDFCICNAWKYIWRWKNKNGQEDLEKADWYITKALHLRDSRSVEFKYDQQLNGIYDYICTERMEIVSGQSNTNKDANNSFPIMVTDEIH